MSPSVLPIKAGDGLVPRIIHMVWVGTEPPAWGLERVEAFRALHPQWDVILWDNSKVPPLSRGKQCPHPVVLADFVRIEALSYMGGIYVDLDTRPLRPLDGLSGRKAWIVPLHTGLISNGAAGFPPGHPMLSELWAESQYRLSLKPARHSTIAGPPVWTRVARKFPAVERIPYQSFYPESNPSKVARTSDAEFLRDARTYAVHEWEQSWQSTYRSRR